MAALSGVERQRAIYLGGVSGRRPRVPVQPALLERRARRALSRPARAYIAAGAGAERTMAANRSAFDRWRIVPRMLRDVSTRDLSVELFGRTLPAPVLTAPIGVLSLAHRQADLAVARAARSLGVPMVLSNQASYPLERCARVLGDSPRWFQLYWSRSDELVASLASRAEANGCEAIVVTLDTTILGWRPRDLDAAFLPFLRGWGIAQYTSDPVFRELARGRTGGRRRPSPAPTPAALRVLVALARAHPDRFVTALRSGSARAAVERFVEVYSRPSLVWEDLAFLRERTRLPILVKGILSPEDARLALQAGIDGIIVSNHGGRQLDGAIATLDALPDVVEAVAGQVPVLLDSGVRTGADIFKALALGARAVLIGRPYVYGLAIAGERGVREVLENLLAELDITVGLAGCRSVAEIGSDSLTRT